MGDRVVRLTFPAKADYLLLARLALSGLARELPRGGARGGDLAGFRSATSSSPTSSSP